jgi:hypothetical protein
MAVTGTVIEICGLPAAGKSSVMRLVDEAASADPDMRCRFKGRASLAAPPKLLPSLQSVPILFRYIVAEAAFPPRQIARVFKAARLAGINKAELCQQDLTLVDGGLIHFICSMAVPARRTPANLACIAELVADCVSGIVVLDANLDLARARARQRLAPHTRFSSISSPAELKRLYADFDRILKELLQQLERCSLPILRLNGSEAPKLNAQHMLSWSRQLHLS